MNTVKAKREDLVRDLGETRSVLQSHGFALSADDALLTPINHLIKVGKVVTANDSLVQDLAQIRCERDKLLSDARGLKHHFQTSLKALEDANAEVAQKIEKKYQRLMEHHKVVRQSLRDAEHDVHLFDALELSLPARGKIKPENVVQEFKKVRRLCVQLYCSYLS